MKNIIFKAISAGLFALIAFVPAFAHADAPATGDSASSAGSAPSTGSSASSASTEAPSRSGSATSAAVSDAPSTGGSATSAAPSTGGSATSAAPSTGGSATSAAPSTGGSATSATPSTGGSATSAENSSGSNNGSSNGSSRSRGGRGGSARIALTNVKIERTATGVKVSWESTPKTAGRVVYGSTSVLTPVTSATNYGYAASTGLSASTDTHSANVPAQAGSVVYLRVVGQNDNRVEFGSEIAVTVPGSVSSPVNSSVTAPSRGATDVDGTLELDLSKKNTSPLVAASAETSFAQKVGGFFKKTWAAIVSVFR